jgi:hypothetical protein
MKKYDKIIVLASGITVDKNGPYKFENNTEKFNYKIIKDPYEFSFKAVKKLFSAGICSNFILVGGKVEIVKNKTKAKFIGKNGTTIPKAEVMKYSLINNYGIPAENLTVLKSASNTIGNAKEILKYFKKQNIKNIDKVGILTCFHHLPRTIKIFKETSNLFFDPICSESVIYNEEFDLIRKFYQKEGLSIILGENKNENSEIKGMGDMEKNCYIPKFN